MQHIDIMVEANIPKKHLKLGDKLMGLGSNPSTWLDTLVQHAGTPEFLEWYNHVVSRRTLDKVLFMGVVCHPSRTARTLLRTKWYDPHGYQVRYVTYSRTNHARELRVLQVTITKDSFEYVFTVPDWSAIRLPDNRHAVDAVVPFSWYPRYSLDQLGTSLVRSQASDQMRCSQLFDGGVEGLPGTQQDYEEMMDASGAVGIDEVCEESGFMPYSHESLADYLPIKRGTNKMLTNLLRVSWAITRVKYPDLRSMMESYEAERDMERDEHRMLPRMPANVNRGTRHPLEENVYAIEGDTLYVYLKDSQGVRLDVSRTPSAPVDCTRRLDFALHSRGLLMDYHLTYSSRYFRDGRATYDSQRNIYTLGGRSAYEDASVLTALLVAYEHYSRLLNISQSMSLVPSHHTFIDYPSYHGTTWYDAMYNLEGTAERARIIQNKQAVVDTLYSLLSVIDYQVDDNPIRWRKVLDSVLKDLEDVDDTRRRQGVTADYLQVQKAFTMATAERFRLTTAGNYIVPSLPETPIKKVSFMSGNSVAHSHSQSEDAARLLSVQTKTDTPLDFVKVLDILDRQVTLEEAITT